MDNLVYFLVGLIIGAFVEPTLALLCRDLAKLILYKKLQKELQKAVDVGLAGVLSGSQPVDNTRLTAHLQDKARLN